MRPKEKIFLHNKENNIRNIFCTLMFQQLLVNKHPRLRDPKSRSRFGRVEVWVWLPTKKKRRKINPVQSKNRARPMAARLIIIKIINPVQSKNRARPMAARLKKKSRAKQEPRSAHGRAVKKKIPCKARTALGPWPRG